MVYLHKAGVSLTLFDCLTRFFVGQSAHFKMNVIEGWGDID